MVGQAPKGFGHGQLRFVLRLGSLTALLPCPRFAAGPVNGQERELPGVVDCSGKACKLLQHGGCSAAVTGLVNYFLSLGRIRALP